MKRYVNFHICCVHLRKVCTPTSCSHQQQYLYNSTYTLYAKTIDCTCGPRKNCRFVEIYSARQSYFVLGGTVRFDLLLCCTTECWAFPPGMNNSGCNRSNLNVYLALLLHRNLFILFGLNGRNICKHKIYCCYFAISRYIA